MAFSLTNNRLTSYVRESYDELRKVSWPTRQTVIKDTLIVIAVSVALGAFFGAIDFGLNKGLERLLS